MTNQLFAAALGIAGRARWRQQCCMENRDGKEDYEDASVDEGRYSDAQDARARKDENNGDRTKAEAERWGNVSESTRTRRDAGSGTKESSEMRAAT
jgi:hypothetical protein